MSYPRLMVLALALVGVGSAALAHDGATGAVKIRMEAMKDFGAQMKIIGAELKGGNRDRAVIAKTAKEIAEGATHIPKQFTERNLSEPTEARGNIWDEFETFTEKSGALEEAAQALWASAVAKSGRDTMDEKFAALGKECASCHERYRIKK